MSANYEDKATHQWINNYTDAMLKPLTFPLILKQMLTFDIPKLHENHTKARFIIVAPKCSLKPLHKSITSISKLMFNQIKSCSKQSFFFLGVKSFWIMFINQLVFDTIKNLDICNKATSITCFDFSTLYASIPHDNKNDNYLYFLLLYRACNTA